MRGGRGREGGRVGVDVYSLSNSSAISEDIKKLSKTESLIISLLCVLCCQRPLFRLFLNDRRISILYLHWQVFMFHHDKFLCILIFKVPEISI